MFSLFIAQPLENSKGAISLFPLLFKIYSRIPVFSQFMANPVVESPSNFEI